MYVSNVLLEYSIVDNKLCILMIRWDCLQYDFLKWAIWHSLGSFKKFRGVLAASGKIENKQKDHTSKI